MINSDYTVFKLIHFGFSALLNSHTLKRELFASGTTGVYKQGQLGYISKDSNHQHQATDIN